MAEKSAIVLGKARNFSKLVELIVLEFKHSFKILTQRAQGENRKSEFVERFLIHVNAQFLKLGDKGAKEIGTVLQMKLKNLFYFSSHQRS